MTIRIQQAFAAVLALSATYVGAWALLAPHSFYKNFPLPGHHWVSLAGAYDEHLVRDVGGLYLSLLVITLGALLLQSRQLFVLTGLAWLIFSVPHLLFHLGHLDGLTTADKVGQTASLAATGVLAALLLPAGKER